MIDIQIIGVEEKKNFEGKSKVHVRLSFNPTLVSNIPSVRQMDK
jgi:hypothetical protein